MAITRMTLEAALKPTPEIDRVKMDATTEDDIRQHMIEDGEDPDVDLDWSKARVAVPARSVRERLGLTVEAFAELIGTPVATVHDWEAGRLRPDSPAQSLLLVLWREPDAALRALRAA